ncbi:MAG: ABC transporter permease [Nitrospinae bacterium]|nr:ABC transporter permease [Nitrospinota bacterium]
MRRSRRTLLTALSVGTGLWVTLLFTGMANHNWANMVKTSVKMGFGHVTIEPTGYLDSPSATKRIAVGAQMLTTAGAMPNVTRAIPRIMAEGMIATAAKTVGGSIIGIDPALESAEYNFFLKSLAAGRLFENADEPGVMVGAKLAEKLNLKVGKKLVYTAADVNGNIVSDLARVTGIFQTDVDAVDGGVILLPINRLRRMLGYAENEATLVAVFLNDERLAPDIRAAIAAHAFPDTETWTWSETQTEIAGMITIDRISHLFFQFFIGLLVAAGILDTILMSVLERKHEFGIMLAVGSSPWFLFRLVLMESFFIGLLGLALGVILNAPLYIYLSRWGYDLSSLLPPGYDLNRVPVDPVMKVIYYPADVAGIAAAIFGLTLLAGLYPAWKASRIPPVESIRNI